MATTLSVLKFDEPIGATRVLEALRDMHEQQMITLEDAAVVSWPRGYKRPVMPHQGVGKMALGGAFWGLLFGLIFLVPFLGAALGAGTAAALWSSLEEEEGIDEEFIKRVSEKVTEGTSALFVLTSGAKFDEVVEELKQYDFELIWTDMPDEKLRQLREVFVG